MRTTSRFRGVTHHCRTQRWEAHIWEAGKQIYLGGFSGEEQVRHGMGHTRVLGPTCVGFWQGFQALRVHAMVQDDPGADLPDPLCSPMLACASYLWSHSSPGTPNCRWGFGGKTGRAGV